MRILLLAASYPPVLGGLQTAVHALACEWTAAGHAVQIVTNRYPRTLPAAETIDGVPVRRLLFLEPWTALFRSRRPDLFLASLYYRPAARARLRALMRDFRPDAVNVHFPDSQIPFVHWLRRRFPFRLVASLHGNDVERYTADKGGLAGAGPLRSFLRAADAVTACSPYLLERAACLEPCVPDKATAIYNGIEPNRFQDRTAHAHPRPYVLALGRLSLVKGFDLLLEAFARLGAVGRDVDLLLAGDGEERVALEQRVHRLGLEGRVCFFGRADPSRVVRLLNGCRFVTVPSRAETFGLAALEALAAGKPVLATRVGGMAQFLTEVSERLRGACAPPVTLVAPTAEALAEGLRERLAAGRDDEVSSNVRTLVLREYSWAGAARRYAQVLAGS